MKIGDLVIFNSHRGNLSGKALGKIIRINRDKSRVEIKRIDIENDTIYYTRTVDEHSTTVNPDVFNTNVFLLDTQDEFMARLQF